MLPTLDQQSLVYRCSNRTGHEDQRMAGGNLAGGSDSESKMTTGLKWYFLDFSLTFRGSLSEGRTRLRNLGGFATTSNNKRVAGSKRSALELTERACLHLRASCWNLSTRNSG